MGIAIGNMGIPYSDFCGFTSEEFDHIYRAWNEQQEAQLRDRWECMRMMATIILQPHVKGNLTPQKVLPFPWEKKKPMRKAPAVSKEDALKRFEEVAKKTERNQ